jgi:ABC-type nitrate/sulfonate/bicarbonate transport system substrate-binding protein
MFAHSRYFQAFRYFQLVLALMTGALLAVNHGAAADETKIRIGYPSGLNAQIPIVMDKAGIAAMHGLEATFMGFQNGPPMMEGLVAGQLDAIVTSTLPPIVLASKLPGQIAVVAALGHSSHALLVRKDSPATDFTDLRGKKIGVSYSTDSHLDLVMTLKARGLAPKTDVELVNLMPNELPSALDKALVDAVVIRQPQVLRLEETIGARALYRWPFHFIAIMRRDYYKQNPETVKRYLDALREAVFYTASNPDEASRWFGEVQRVDPAVVRRLAGENPLYAAKSADEIALEVLPSMRDYISERLDAAFEHGFIREKVLLESLLP